MEGTGNYPPPPPPANLPQQDSQPGSALRPVKQEPDEYDSDYSQPLQGGSPPKRMKKRSEEEEKAAAAAVAAAASSPSNGTCTDTTLMECKQEVLEEPESKKSTPQKSNKKKKKPKKPSKDYLQYLMEEYGLNERMARYAAHVLQSSNRSESDEEPEESTRLEKEGVTMMPCSKAAMLALLKECDSDAETLYDSDDEQEKEEEKPKVQRKRGRKKKRKVEEEDDEEEAEVERYEISKVVGYVWTPGKDIHKDDPDKHLKYIVKWKGYDYSYNQVVPYYEEGQTIMDAIQDFHAELEKERRECIRTGEVEV